MSWNIEFVIFKGYGDLIALIGECATTSILWRVKVIYIEKNVQGQGVVRMICDWV